MNGKEFIRKVRKMARKTGVPANLEKDKGKGGHQRLYYGQRWTTVKTGEIGTGLLRTMCRQLGIDPKDL